MGSDDRRRTQFDLPCPTLGDLPRIGDCDHGAGGCAGHGDGDDAYGDTFETQEAAKVHLQEVQFSIVRRDVSLAVPGRPIISASAPAELAADNASCYFFVGLPSDFESDNVKPCWARRG